MLRAWDDTPAIIVSCPGPPRRHHAAIQPLAGLSLPQCLLGGEAQLLAFAAAAASLAPRLYFCPMPELFSGPQSMQALQAATGNTPFTTARPVHLRFGGTRSARIMKDARNGLVLAENHANPPITTSQHPFADGLTLPTQIRRLFTYDAAIPRPVTLGGGAIQTTRLPPESLTADLAHTPDQPNPDTDGAPLKGAPLEGAPLEGVLPEGLELVSLAEFRSALWAAGPVRARSAHFREARANDAATSPVPFVLVPWNLDHPGSAVTALLERTMRLQSIARPAVRLLLMPYNYPGQTGLIRRLIRQLRDASQSGPAVLPQTFIGRLSHLAALPTLRHLAATAWIDGNDPEAAWTARRLAACGIKPILLGAIPDRLPPAIPVIPADDPLTITTETRFGPLHFRGRIPSMRALHDLLSVTRDMSAPVRPRRLPRAAITAQA